MGEQIIVQPDGRLCVFSSIVDAVTLYDATDEELLDYYAERAARDARESIRRSLAHVRAGEPRRAYHQFARSFDEAVATALQHHDDGGEAVVEFRARGWVK